MAKHPKHKSDKSTSSNAKSISSNTKSKAPTTKKKATKSNLSHYVATLLGIIVAFVAYILYNNWLQSRIYTPLNVPKAVVKSGLEVPERYWGNFRPGVYFGFKTRNPQSPVFGLMWFRQEVIDKQLPLRHQCSMGNYDQRYTWLEHDGTNFGIQSIYDGPISLTNSFVKRTLNHGGEWTTKITAQNANTDKKALVSLLFYVALDEVGFLEPQLRNNFFDGISGNTPSTGRFRLRFITNSSNAHTNYLSTVTRNLGTLEESVMRGLTRVEKDKYTYFGLGGEIFPPNVKSRNPNFVVYQVTFLPPFELTVIYETETNDANRETDLAGDFYLETLESHRQEFNHQLDEQFGLSADRHSQKDLEFAKAALSNLVGGIGYFYGKSVVKSSYSKDPVYYFEGPLYTAVPSRSFFPRGFLWDEGFHLLLIARWNLDIAKDIIAHWLDMINIEGWIPREQILDTEAQSRVPPEFIVQHNTFANPPALFLPLKYIVNQMDEDDLGFLKNIFPRLTKWYQWFNTTQVGKLAGSYRWRGRNNNSLEELNPITLTSGLDDYPRASNPTADERHVDLRCWMAIAAGVLADIARAIGESADIYDATNTYLSDNNLLNDLHWSPDLQAYTDYGLHSNNVKLRKQKPPSPGAPQPVPNPIRVYIEEPKLQHVNNFGYVSLFPFLLKIVSPSSEKLTKILTDLEDPNLLWTPYGLRSLAKSSPYYQKNNNPNNPPYWRGAIWINMNYLAVDALKYYGGLPGPNKDKANELYSKLKSNIVKNLSKEYWRTGYIWEQYNDSDGSGQRAHPFTGWSALVALIMSEV
ncbi:hypothetical protein CHUAL_011214 [Chamberlinius hualienensis]